MALRRGTAVLVLLASAGWIAAEPESSPAACPDRDPQACLELADLHRSDLVRADAKRARGLYEAACDLGSAEGCDRAAALYAEERGQDWEAARDKEEALRARAAALFTASCAEATPSACWTLGTAYQHRVSNAAGFYRRALQLSEEQCRRGEVLGCYDLARRGRREDVGERWRDLMDKACDGAVSRACTDLASRIRGSDPLESALYYEKGCAAGDGSACHDLAAAYRDGHGVAADGERALQLDAAACLKGYDQACSGLGGERPARGLLSSAGDAAQEAARLLDRACRGGDRVACIDLAGALRTGFGVGPRGVAADLERSIVLYEAMCQALEPRACVELGLLLSPARGSGTGALQDEARSATLLESGMRLYQERCEAGAVEACAALGSLYLQPAPVETDRNQALTLLEKACRLGDGASCMKVAEVHRQIANDYEYEACRNGLSEACRRMPVMAAGPPPLPPFTEVEVFFATDRQRSGRDRPSRWWERSVPRFYGADRSGALEYGVCTVTIPKEHEPGGMEAPSVLSLEFEEDPRKHVVLKSLTRFDDTAPFFERMQAATAAKGPGDVLLFIHGFNVSFEEAMRRAAVLVYDLSRDGGFSGVAAAYSWPSRASLSLTGYTGDLNAADETVERLRGFLNQLVLESGARRVHVVAHSMGNRALTAALQQMALVGETRIENAVFAAPDVDVGVFRNRVAAFLPKVGRVTLYASSEDRAIQASRKFNGGVPRAGDGGDALVVLEGMDTIEASQVESGFLGHSYFAEADALLKDLYALLKYGFAPPMRQGLTSATRGQLPYWILAAPGP